MVSRAITSVELWAGWGWGENALSGFLSLQGWGWQPATWSQVLEVSWWAPLSFRCQSLLAMTSWRAVKQWSTVLQFASEMTKNRKYKQGKGGGHSQRRWVIPVLAAARTGSCNFFAWKPSIEQDLGGLQLQFQTTKENRTLSNFHFAEEADDFNKSVWHMPIWLPSFLGFPANQP